ncbi:MAG: ABC transporter ATP-binding protein [Actinomycetota bacterium]|nr:ABC transporter ATP-binding protein [Actinomycetota bacterium]
MTLQAEAVVRRGGFELAATLGLSPGQTMGLLGPNGAGKSTLLAALAGLVPLQRGRVVLDGAVLEDPAAGIRLAPEDRGLGVVFQDLLLFPHLSALDNVAYGLRRRGWRRRPARRQAAGWLGRVGLSHRARARPSALSGGEAQRVALARALASRPRLVLLDEPLSSLDASARPEARRLVAEQLSGFEGARLVVTHDPLEAVALADRLVVLEDGRITQEGTPEDLRSRPRSRYVADLVGVNLLRGTACGDHVVLAGGHRLTISDVAHGEVLAVVHPRAVAVHRQAPTGSPRNVVRGPILSLDEEGGRVRLAIGGPLPLTAELTRAAATELRLAEGGEVWASVKATEVSAYPA